MYGSLLKMAASGLLTAGLVTAAYLFYTVRRNAWLLRAVEAFDECRQDVREALLIGLHRLFDRPSSEWTPVLARDGITVATSFSACGLTGGRGVRTYRALSFLSQNEISVDRMLALLDGGFLNEEVWFKKDFKGGRRVEELDPPPGQPAQSAQTAWIASYVSDVKPLKLREFVYLLCRRALEPAEFSRCDPCPGRKIMRQACIAYRSVRRPGTHSAYVRAIQYPSLDRITLYDDGTIGWEHIMAFHIAGVIPLWLNNLLVRAAAKVLYEEAANMRKHRHGES